MLRSRITIGTLAVTAFALGACGSTQKYPNQPRPPIPVNLTVYINDARVSVSPTSVGAGPVVFHVTNQASKAESLAIAPSAATGGQPLASTGPINPQATAQVTVNFVTQGNYTVSISNGGATDAALATPSSIQPAQIHIGAARQQSGGVLLTP